MNSKNSFIKMAVIFFLIALQTSLFAQTLKYESQRYKISLPSLREGNPGQTNPYPYYTILLETGDGNYIKDTNHIDKADINNPYVIPYNLAITGDAVLNIIGHYDTIKPPKELYTWTPHSTATWDAPPQITLPNNKKVGFAYADKTVAIGHTMTYVVTYKPDNSANTVVAFFYNDKDALNGQKVFSEITHAEQSIPFTVADGTSTTTRDIRAIRVKESTTLISITPPQELPSQVADMLAGSKGSFNNAIYFVIPYSANDNERNAFISMKQPLNSSLLGSSATIKAVLITYNKRISGYTSKDSVIDVLPISELASDPNGIRTTPHCLDTLPGGVFNKPINYDVTFNNKGKGAARHIEITVLIPEGVQLNPSQVLNVRSTVSRKIIPFYKEPGIDKPNTYKIIANGTEKKIIFNMKNIELPGLNTTRTSRKDILERSGTISFTLYTIKDPHNSDIANDKLSCMYSDVSIVFTSVDRGMEKINDPVTGYDLIRKNCSFISPLPPPCPRKSTAVFPPITQ